MSERSLQANCPRLILASASPRRHGLLAEWGYAFETIRSPVEEPSPDSQDGSPAQVAKALSKFKAENVAYLHTDAIVLGADTVVALEGKLYGKPRDADDARRILSTLMHHRHEVFTGITVIDGRSGKRIVVSDESQITMTPMSPEQLDGYIDSGLWEGKAGAYGVQDHNDQFVKRLEGSFTNVVGLPKDLVMTTLASCGVLPSQESCQRTHREQECD